MDYFTAVQQGKARVKKAVDFLQEVAGPSYPVLFLKTGHEDWLPVGEEKLYALVQGKGGTAAVVLCDADGNSKAISGWVPANDAERFCSDLASRGTKQYAGEIKLPI
jgi:hypothetical protein